MFIGSLALEEIKRVAVACGLPDFRYYSFPATAFAPPQADSAKATPPDVAESAGIGSVGASAHRRPEVIEAPAEVLPAPPLPVPTYSLLAEVAEAVANPRPATIRINSPATARNVAQLPSRPARRRPQPAGRAALAAISQS
jgi:hypothetical protein